MQIIKETIEWRLIAIVITFTITYLWTGKLVEAVGLTIVLNLAKTIAYYIWRKVKLGHINRENIQPKRVLNTTYALWGKLRKGCEKKYKREKV